MYPTIIPLNTRICIDVRLKEKLRCEYLTTEHERRPDFPPDIVLQDQAAPELILIDQVLPTTYWAIEFGEEIVVTPWPFAQGVQGVILTDGWYLTMRGGEMVVQQEKPPAPLAWNTAQAPFILTVVNGELVYTPRAALPNQEFFNIAWALYFRQEITVIPWPHVTPINGWVITEPWVLRMKRGEIVMATTPVPVPFWQRQPERWWFTLYVDSNGELHYEPAPKV